MKAIIIYCSIDYGAGVFATPQETNREYVEYENEQQLQKYIESKKDMYSCSFKKVNKDSAVLKLLSFDYISNQGGVEVRKFVIKKLK